MLFLQGVDAMFGLHGDPIYSWHPVTGSGQRDTIPSLSKTSFLSPTSEVWGKVIFSLACVILFTGGGGSFRVCTRGHMTRGFCIWGGLPTVGSACSWSDSRRGLHPGDLCPERGLHLRGLHPGRSVYMGSAYRGSTSRGLGTPPLTQNKKAGSTHQISCLIIPLSDLNFY